MINCPICSKEVLATANASYFNNSDTLYFNHQCSEKLYPNFWGYFDKETLLPDELLIRMRHIEFYQENYEWTINSGHDDNVVTIATGDTSLSLESAYLLLKRYDKLLIFS